VDLDHDGKPDLVTVEEHHDRIVVFRNISAGEPAFAAPIYFKVGRGPTRPVSADFDGDGHPDLAVANRAGRSISILHSLGRTNGIGADSFAPAVDIPAGAAAEGLAVDDLDGDGKPDLVATHIQETFVSVFQNIHQGG